MKNFFTSMLGTIVGLCIFCFVAVLLCIGLVGAFAAIGSNAKTAGPVLENGSYIVFDLDANLTDAPARFEFGELSGGKTSTLQLRAVTHAIRAAAHDDRVAGMLIKGELSPAGYGTGYAALREVRNALLAFKNAGKPVKAYLTTATTKDYYLASAAGEVALDPYGEILMPGLATEEMFYAGAFEKYGINVQVTRVGKYKSFVEPYTRQDMSPENREEVQKLLNDVWGGLLSDIASSRSLTPAKIQATVDAQGLIRADAAKAAKLVDRIAYPDEIIDELKAATGRKASKESFKQVTLADYIKTTHDIVDTSRGSGVVGTSTGGRNRIAVIYAEGEIVDGEGDLNEVGGDRFAREIRAVRQDDGVRAIVLRVNSPGGSVSASEAIQREVRLAEKTKPVIISMGSYAASGGYWISTYGDRIFAEPTTITGSIGVFGIQFDLKKLANNLGFTFDTVKTGKFADSLTITRPKTPEELAVAQNMVDWIYGEFVRKVAESRKLEVPFVEEIAQGRVWSGTEAKKLGLVDEIGGLDAALAYAAKKVNLGNYRITEYPRRKELAEVIKDMLGRVPSMSSRTPGIAGQVADRVQSELKFLQTFTDPNGMYARLPMQLSIR